MSARRPSASLVPRLCPEVAERRVVRGDKPLECPTSGRSSGFDVSMHRLSLSASGAWMLRDAKKTLDNVEVGPYATASMSSPLSPEILKRGAIASMPGPKGGMQTMPAKKKAAKKATKKKK